MYYGRPPRIYILTQKEVETKKAFCPKCGKVLGLVPFTKSDKLYRCKSCNFFIPKSCVLVERVKIDSDLKEILDGMEEQEIGDQIIKIAKILKELK